MSGEPSVWVHDLKAGDTVDGRVIETITYAPVFDDRAPGGYWSCWDVTFVNDPFDDTFSDGLVYP